MHVHGTECRGCGENPAHQASSERIKGYVTFYVTRLSNP